MTEAQLAQVKVRLSVRQLRNALHDLGTAEKWYYETDLPGDLPGHLNLSTEKHGAFAQVVYVMEEGKQWSSEAQKRARYVVKACPEAVANLFYLYDYECKRAQIYEDALYKTRKQATTLWGAFKLWMGRS